MGTEVLRPQNILVERIRAPPASFSRRRNYWNHHNSSNNYYAANPRSNRKPASRSERVDQRKRVGCSSQQQQPEALVSKRSSSDDLKMAKSGLVMEKVTILRRGESLDSKIKNEALKKEGGDLVVCGTQRLGPDPEMVPKQIRIVDTKHGSAPAALMSDVYAGSAFAMSPSPSALPLPSFSKKHLSAFVDDSATRDLRRLLRLE
ncbi:hypothetical protein L6164_025535 [Bauhinia variegata]|uniref:Uncharacterized protein n=1 Tax=Bauhinia variegata TaxID=167791 RepID=A0ACB9M1P1_BAUVA|nr:hypothetical protein L6164_025535 [Bauhinia variegata]